MEDWRQVLVYPNTAILKALQIIDEQSTQIALVVDDNKRLLGTVTDGDVRRGLLRGVSLDDPVSVVMYKKPSFVRLGENCEQALQMMKQKHIYQIPVVDQNMIVLGLKLLGELIQPLKRDNWVVLMAGGLGTRLRPLTDQCPKPLLKVGEKPILETILENFIEHGFYKFFMAVNYKAGMIEDYFGNGFKWGVDIQYLRENQRLGTAGALSLLPQKPDKPVFVMNGDLLTKVNFSQMFDYHLANASQITICVREYDFQVPYGVLSLTGDEILGIKEKPIHKFHVSAGIYLLGPKILEFIPNNEYIDMPQLLDQAIKRKMRVTAFPVREYWIDVGRMSDYERANGEYKQHFL